MITVGEFGKPNPPAPFPGREGGAWKPLPDQGEGFGEGSAPSLIDQQYQLVRSYQLHLQDCRRVFPAGDTLFAVFTYAGSQLHTLKTRLHGFKMIL